MGAQAVMLVQTGTVNCVMPNFIDKLTGMCVYQSDKCPVGTVKDPKFDFMCKDIDCGEGCLFDFMLEDCRNDCPGDFYWDSFMGSCSDLDGFAQQSNKVCVVNSVPDCPAGTFYTNFMCMTIECDQGCLFDAALESCRHDCIPGYWWDSDTQTCRSVDEDFGESVYDPDNDVCNGQFI